jgi:hypothetical protein
MGGPRGNLTPNPGSDNGVLCQLSYTGRYLSEAISIVCVANVFEINVSLFVG